MTIYKNFVKSIKTLKSKFVLLVFLLGLTLLGSVTLKTDVVLAQQFDPPALTIKIDPTQTFIFTGFDLDADTKPLDLQTLGINPGNTIVLERLGYYSVYPNSDNQPFGTMIATFSTDDTLLANIPSLSNDRADRVPGAINADFPNGCREKQCIGKSFLISNGVNDGSFKNLYNGILVTVPKNARYLFICALDAPTNDNSDSNNDFAIGIIKI